MAASVIDRPGVGNGPCEECEHTDCAEQRADSERPCAICEKPIGYGVRYFMDATGAPGKWRWTHMICRVQEIEATKAKKS